MKPERQELSSYVDPALLESLRELAEAEGRDLRAVLEEALRKYVESHHGEPTARPTVLAHARTSIEKNRRLGELLAK